MNRLINSGDDQLDKVVMKWYEASVEPETGELFDLALSVIRLNDLLDETILDKSKSVREGFVELCEKTNPSIIDDKGVDYWLDDYDISELYDEYHQEAEDALYFYGGDDKEEGYDRSRDAHKESYLQ